jgi:hypothetical protein
MGKRSYPRSRSRSEWQADRTGVSVGALVGSHPTARRAHNTTGPSNLKAERTTPGLAYGVIEAR